MACLISGPDEDARANTISALKNMGLVGAAVLVSQLDQQDVVRRGACVDALRSMGPSGVAGLGGALLDDIARVRSIGATALGRIGGDAAPLVSLLTGISMSDADSSVRQAAVSSLGYIMEAPGPKTRTVNVFGQLGGQQLATEVAAQVKAIREKEPEVRKARQPKKKKSAGLFSCFAPQARA
eukprot:TRINITY_DN35828_c0_g1_i3.p1 TRINITY_DN35828_c0_g1~~TRINITY_DN35828_c0_g1_i3.p1  ORF type:complete len:182 (+),score=50.76 TRINITY_DN35828_c0_g1_i3:312-857(+)